MEALGRSLCCPVCLDLLRPPVRELPCAHNYCQLCLEGVLPAQGCKSVNGRFSCPVCRAVVYLRGRGIIGLQRNILAENVLEKFKEALASIHAKEKNQLLQTCEEHGEVMNLMCVYDDKPICGTCKLFGNHEPHHVAKLSETYAARKHCFAEDLQLAFKKSENAMQAAKDTEKLINELTSTTADTNAMIDAIGSSLLNEINYRIAELKVKLGTEHSTKLAKLKSVASELEATRQLYFQMKTLFEQHSNSVQFLKEDKKLRNEMEKLRNCSFPPDDLSKTNISIGQYFEKLIKGVQFKDFVSSTSDGLLSRIAEIYGTWKCSSSCPAMSSTEILNETFCSAIVGLFRKSSDIKKDYSSNMSSACSSSGNNYESSGGSGLLLLETSSL